jgi:hypothetical protein
MTATTTTTTTTTTTNPGVTMAEITIRFRHNKTTGKRELVIHLESDDDVLGHEHERDHRRLVEQLLGAPIDEDTGIVIERGDGAPSSTSSGSASSTPSTTTTARTAQGNKG